MRPGYMPDPRKFGKVRIETYGEPVMHRNGLED